MRFITRMILPLAAALGLAQPAAAQEFPERGTAPVVDAANIIDDATEAALTQKLDQFEEANQRQFVIATIPDLQGYDIADYGYRLGREWALGDAERNDGILLIVVLIVVLQLWLLTASMNAVLGGDHGVAVPAAVASLVCLGLNVGLLWYLYRLDG